MERTYQVALAQNRKVRIWDIRSMTWPELVEKMKRPVRTGETAEEYRRMPRARQADVKDVGGFVGGFLKDGLRKKTHVVSRSLLTLDMDHGHPGVVSEVLGKLSCTCFLYSTHKSRPESPRLRLVIPLLRDVSAAEYGAISRKVAEYLGMALFDPTTFEPERLMYWGSVSKDGEYVAEGQERELLDPDKVLAEDKLFATLDPTTRRLRFPEEHELVLADTVGFIRNLPKELTEAFQATLEELEAADLLLHVADASHPELDRQIAAVDGILADMELNEVPRVLILNKWDRLEDEMRDILRDRWPDALPISAETRDGLNVLSRCIENTIHWETTANIEITGPMPKVY
mgnify:CR=1 FL=1